FITGEVEDVSVLPKHTEGLGLLGGGRKHASFGSFCSKQSRAFACWCGMIYITVEDKKRNFSAGGNSVNR
uniref:Uncharacterized protein n=1 Tax=Romanomermis culicivorax TaxID=13658 RepID=A0A915KXH4_ROMCU